MLCFWAAPRLLTSSSVQWVTASSDFVVALTCLILWTLSTAKSSTICSRFDFFAWSFSKQSSPATLSGPTALLKVFKHFGLNESLQSHQGWSKTACHCVYTLYDYMWPINMNWTWTEKGLTHLIEGRSSSANVEVTWRIHPEHFS